MEMFSTEWFDACAAAFPAEANLTLIEGQTVALTILGGPDGDVPTVWSVDGGKLTVQVKPAEDASVTMTIPWNDALVVVRGDVAPAVVYMQGKLKAAGDMTCVLALLEQGSSPECKTWITAVR